MKRRYGVAISAMILAAQLAGPAHAAEPSLEQLETISALLDANDVQELRAYLLSHPELLDGTTDLSLLLSAYMEESSNVVSYLGVFPEPADDGDPDLVARLEARLGPSDELGGSFGEPRSPAADVPGADPDVSIY